MKTLLVTVLILPLCALAQSKPSCCSVSSTAQFAMLGADEKFRMTHLEPIPLNFAPEQGKLVTFPTGEGKEGRAFEVKATKATANYVFMIHEWWGLNEYIQREAERLQKEIGNVNVLALDLYDSKVATTREDAAKYMNDAKEDRIRAIVKGAFEYVGARARVGTVGWCFGGGWSLQTALMGGKQVAACVVYYGMPETDVEVLRTLNGPVLGIFAEKDGWVTPAKVKEFEDAMGKAKKKLTVKMYDADHAFANPSNPMFDKQAASDAHKRTIEFLKKNLLK